MCFNLQWSAILPDGLTFMLVLAIFSSVLGMVQFGFNTGCMNTPEDVFRSFLNQSYYHRWGRELSSDGMDLLWSTTVSIFAIGGMLGGLGGFVADLFGRKCGLLLNNVFAIVGATLLSSSKYFNSFECLILGRFIIGLNCGLNTTLVPMYISEISPINLRGSLGTISQLGVTIGLLLSQILGLPNVLGTNANWPTLLGIAFVPAILQLATLPFSAESPRYLYFNERHSEAKAALQRFRCRRNVDEDLEEMKQEQQPRNEKTMTILQLLSSSSLRMPLIIAVVMQLSQQLSGINAIFYYSTDVFIKAGVDKSVAKNATMAVGATMVIMTIVSVPLMDRAGRRTLHLYGLGGMFLTSIFLTISLLVRFIYQSMSYVSVVSSLLFTLFFAIGPGSIPWLITAELFSQGPRPAAISIAVLINWSTNFIVGLVFPLMNRVFESYSFLPFTVFIAIFWTFTYHRVPETKNRTFDEIAALFKIVREDDQLDNGSIDYPGSLDGQGPPEESSMSNGVTKGVSFSPPQAGYHIHHFHQPSLIVPTQTHTFNYLDLNNQLDMHHSHHGLASAMPTHPAPVAFSSHPALHNQAIISPHISPHNLQAHPHNIMISPNILTSPTGLLPSDALRPHLTSQTLIPVHPTAQPLPIAHASSHGVLTMSNSPPFFTSTPATLKPILHTGGKHHKTKKRSGAKATIDDQCLMTNHQIEDQL